MSVEEERELLESLEREQQLERWDTVIGPDVRRGPHSPDYAPPKKQRRLKSGHARGAAKVDC